MVVWRSTQRLLAKATKLPSWLLGELRYVLNVLKSIKIVVISVYARITTSFPSFESDEILFS
jgi:hypothetical protein